VSDEALLVHLWAIHTEVKDDYGWFQDGGLVGNPFGQAEVSEASH